MGQNFFYQPTLLGTRGWSNRILIASVSGILFLTLYPFRFDFAATTSGHLSPFYLDVTHKAPGFLDAFLNILLFVPFGVAIASYFHRRKHSWVAIFSGALVVGAVSSYFIEFLQIYVPGRDSGWEDVYTNATGSLVGAVLFMMVGPAVLAPMSRAEVAVTRWLSVRRIALTAVIYFILFLGISIPLQRETRLNNWDSSCPIFIGDDAFGKSAWKGRVSLIQIWDRPWEGNTAPFMLGTDLNAEQKMGLFTFYDLAGSAPFEDKIANLPALVPWIRLGPGFSSTYQGNGGFTRLTTVLPVSKLAQEIQRTNRFSIRIDFTPLGVETAEGDIFSISNARGINDLLVLQEGTDISILIRSNLSTRRARLNWTIPDFIIPNQPVSLLISYDGSRANLYRNGRKMESGYLLSPGASLMRSIIRIKTFELPAYNFIYDVLIFVPIGIFLGLASRNVSSRGTPEWTAFLSAVITPPVILEILLVTVSGRAYSISLVLIGIALTMASFLWINSDRPETA